MTITIKKLTTKKLTGRTRVSVVMDIPHDRGRYGDTPEEEHGYIQEAVGDNKWVLEHFASFRCWDYSYNLHMFADSLKATGDSLLKYDRHKSSDKVGKRALHVSALLHRAADGYSIPDEIDTMSKRWKRRVTRFVPHGNNLSRMEEGYKFDNAMGMDRARYETKMTSLALDKHNEAEESTFNQAFDLLKKHIRRFWS